MTLGSTQLLTEMSTKNLPVGKGWQAHKADNLTTPVSQLSKKFRILSVLTLWTSADCYRDSFTFLLYMYLYLANNFNAVYSESAL
jgi:hypothetical protein